ncbi:hypothetical protein JCM8097_004355 [Rhodosporidiobolus ruineniae]
MPPPAARRHLVPARSLTLSRSTSPLAPPPPPSPRSPLSLGTTVSSDLDPVLDEDLFREFAAALQSSSYATTHAASEAEAEAEAEDLRQLHPQWEQGGRLRPDEDGAAGGLFVGETVGGEADVGAEGAAVEEWVDWRELLGAGGEREGEGVSLEEVVEEVVEEMKVQVSPPPAPASAAEPSTPSAFRPSLSSHRETPSPPPAVESVAAPSPSPFQASPRRRRAGPLLLRPVERLTHASLAPYIPPSLPSSASPSDPPAPVEPDHLPLTHRYDWRLSSPLRRFLRTSPPPLFSLEETATLPLGHGRLVGVGPEAARIARKAIAMRSEEQWGWKVRVPAEKERGEWAAADAYKKRMLRLLDLSRTADESAYRASLLRSGSPSQRESKGLTVCRATGVWLTDTSKLAELAEMGEEERRGRRKREELAAGGGGGAAGGPAKAIAEFAAEDGRELGEEHGLKFFENSVLRFTRAPNRSAPSPSPTAASSTGPQPPTGGAAAAAGGMAEWFVQGSLLEIRDGKLVVAFAETDMWPLGDEAYQIDLGLDLSSYTLQEAALENLYLDPSRQRTHNAAQVEKIQATFLQAGIAAPPREWALQGTELREVLVPALAVEGKNAGTTLSLEEEEMDDASPAAELAHLPPPAVSLLPLDLPCPSASAAAVGGTDEALHPSTLLRSNQLINSWIRRYGRENPMVMPGDPELGLNESQTRAIAMALGEKLSLIQGPPGTGKSQTIVSLIALLKLHFRVPFPILLAAPTHVSVDHLLSLLVRAGLNPLRCGKASKVSSAQAERWTIEKRQEGHPLWERMEKAREESETARAEMLELREAVAVGAVQQKQAEKAEFDLEEKYRKAWRRFIMLEQKLYASLLATADVFCATALGSGSSKVLSMVDFPLVLLDEAAMCTEPVSLIPLMKGAQHATLIGDHKQLPAVITSQDAKNERLHISLFERLLANNAVKSTLLDTQYRMRPDISAFPNLSFYHSALRDAAAVSQRPPPPKSRFFASPSSPAPSPGPISLKPKPPHSDSPPAEPIPVAFVSHDGQEALHRQSLINRDEVQLLVEIVGDLLDQNPTLAAGDIGIISPYYAQTRLLINTFEGGYASMRLRRLLGAKRSAEVAEVEVNTVDGFQGREKRVVLLSTVRSNKGGHIGFLTDRRRLNVALTRARDALIVVGNQETLRRAAMNEWSGADPDADAGVWRRFLAWCDRRGLVKEYRREKE